MIKEIDLNRMFCLNCNMPFLNCICKPKVEKTLDNKIKELIKQLLGEYEKNEI